MVVRPYCQLRQDLIEEREKCSRLFLEVEADVNAQDKDSRTALLSVARSATVTCVVLLLKTGADVNIRSKDGSVVISNTAVSVIPRDTLCGMM